MTQPLDPRLLAAAPFAAAFMVLPLAALGVVHGGWVLAMVVVYVSGLMPVIDAFSGVDETNIDPDTDPAGLRWYRWLNRVWVPCQTVLLFGALIYLAQIHDRTWSEEIAVAVVVGAVCGIVGIVYAHELFHRPDRLSRILGEILMIQVLYGHFVSGHLRVHHVHVATPADPATARYNESFYWFFIRVLWQGFATAWTVEADRCRRRGWPAWHVTNPFWRYLGGGAVMIALAAVIGGLWGVVLYLTIALTAVIILEQINYVEHYGLTRAPRADGSYEPVQPHHSWDDAHPATNYLLINLQRHADHHVKPGRDFPLLQSYPASHTPRLPFSYPWVTIAALNPWLWRRMMNPRVRKWRSIYYPGVTDWRPGAG